MSRLVVAVDVGGTFTDVTMNDLDTAEVWSLKTPTTSTDPSIGFLTGVREVLAQAHAGPEDVVRVLHGTTIATNAILESKGAPTGLVTTRGFKYVLEIGRHDAPGRVNLLSWVKPKRPVAPGDVREVSGRVAVDGSELEPLSDSDCREAARYFKSVGIDSIAICFLHSFTNPEHEVRARAIIAEEYPEAWVSISSEVLPVFREYERSMATVLNCYVMGLVSAYVGRLRAGLEQLSIDAPLYVMKSNGGVIGLETVVKQPAFTALSGPAAGVVGACEVGKATGFDDLISIDVGGTSADVCLVRGGRAEFTTEGHVGAWPLATPMLDIHTVGAGGGSIASVTPAGNLIVGPASAGADPGPACYGRGGQLPTVTDANLVLGRLPLDLTRGGEALDVAAARRAIQQHVADPLGIDVTAAAAGIVEIINNNMMGALRVITVERGIDPRAFTLFGFGGAGPLHAASVARLLDVPRVLIGRSPGVLSALGLHASDLRNDFARTCMMKNPTRDDVGAILKALDQLAFGWLNSEGIPEDKQLVTWQADVRYPNQVFELTVDIEREPAGPPDLDKLYKSFHVQHEQLYTFCLRDSEVEIVNLRASAIGILSDSGWSRRHSTVAPVAPEPTTRRQVYFGEHGEFVECPIYDRLTLSSGAQVTGPAVITQMDTTTVVLPGQDIQVDNLGNLVITDRPDWHGVSP